MRVVGRYLSGLTGHVVGGAVGHTIGSVPGLVAGTAAADIAGSGAKGLAARMTSSAIDRASNIIRSGGALPPALAPMGPRMASPLAALLTGSGVSAFQPAQPYAPGLGAAFAQ